MCRRWEWAGGRGDTRGSDGQGEDLAGEGRRGGQGRREARCRKGPGFPKGQDKNVALDEATTREMSMGEDCPRSNTSAQGRRRRCGGIRSLAEGGRNLARMR